MRIPHVQPSVMILRREGRDSHMQLPGCLSKNFNLKNVKETNVVVIPALFDPYTITPKIDSNFFYYYFKMGHCYFLIWIFRVTGYLD